MKTKKFFIVVLVVLFGFGMVSCGSASKNKENKEKEINFYKNKGFSLIEFKFPFFDEKCRCYYQDNFYPGKNGNIVFLCTDPGNGRTIYIRKHFSVNDPQVCIIAEYKKEGIWEWGSYGCNNKVTMIKKMFFKWRKGTTVSIPSYQFSEKGITDRQVASVQLFMKFFEDVFQKKVKNKIKYHW